MTRDQPSVPVAEAQNPWRGGTPLPPIFDIARAERTLQSLSAIAPELTADDRLRSIIASVAGNSPYLAGLILKQSEYLARLFALGAEHQLEWLNAEIAAAAEEESIAAAQKRLRVAKQRAGLTIALSDICGVFDLDSCMAHLSRFASACVGAALTFQIRSEARREGLGESPAADESGLIIIAMGKMGAMELNYSSDIDLIVFFDEQRFPFTRSGDGQAAAVELIKGMVRLLSETTADGYVFRTDLRLRPDAGSTQIAIPTTAAEAYYEAMGQNWERAAWIKARQCAGDFSAGRELLKRMEPFVWRKHLDYAAIADIHSIKRQIHSLGGHGRIAVAGHNIKLGRGGIREIEFFVQTQQLILGGRDPALRDVSTLGALKVLFARGHISAEAEHELADAYRFLRMVEHRLQMIDDQQTHVMPKSPDGLDHVARFAGFDDTNAFEETLRRKLSNVQKHYARLFESEEPLSVRTGSLVFTGVEEDPETLATLSRLGFANPAAISAVIRGWHHGRIRANRSARARELLTRLIPPLLKALSETADPYSAFMHFDRFLSGLPSGVQLFSMLLANRRLLDLLAEIAGSAPRLSGYLGRNPAVLDALIDPGFLAQLPSAGELESQFARAVSGEPGYEAALDAARRFAKEEMFRVGARLIFGSGPPADAGPAFSALADTVVTGLASLIETEFAEAHGRVSGGQLAVVALGKLGGREMTFTSDLDLVFIYTHDPGATQSNGEKPLPVISYFARLAQRFIAALTSLTSQGRLYEVDMRLRPSGSQGPVAVSLDRFVSYHRDHSWTWELLALTRARVVAGPAELRDRIEGVVPGLLSRRVNAAQIKADAREMRQKLATQFPARSGWDLKFAPGGLVDIEFTAQLLQLCAAGTADVLDQNTIAAVEKSLAGELLDKRDGGTLISAARLQQDLTQVLRVAIDGEFRPETASAGLKALLARVAGLKDFTRLEPLLQEQQSAAHAVFARILDLG